MFPRLRQRLGTGVIARLDVLVELSTLGEYGLSEEGRPLALPGRGRGPSATSVRTSAGGPPPLARRGPPVLPLPAGYERLAPRTRDICPPHDLQRCGAARL